MIKKLKYLILLLMIGGGLQAAPFIVRGVVTNNSIPAPQKWVRVQFPQGGDTSVVTDARGEYIVTINPSFRIGTILTSFTDVCGLSIQDTNSFDSLTVALISNLTGCTQQPQTNVTIKGSVFNLPNPYYPIFINYTYSQFNLKDSVLVDSNGSYFKAIPTNSSFSIDLQLKDCNLTVLQDSAFCRPGDTVTTNFNFCGTPPNSYFGTVTHNGLPVSSSDAFLLRYAFNVTDQRMEFTDTLQIGPNGRFLFPNDNTSDYLIKALPRSNQQDFSATYYPSGPIWSSNGKSLVIGPHIPDSNALIINLNSKQRSATGRGVIAGEVLVDKTLNIGGYSAVGIHLLNDNEEAVDFKYADASGNFLFENLAIGEYLVWIDQCGIPTEPISVSITSQNESIDGLIITANQLGISYNDFVSTEEFSSGLSDLKAYPNPFSSQLKIHSPLDAEISVINLMGQPITSMILLENEIRTIDTEAWPAGFYVVNVHSKNENYSIKLLKD